MVNIIQISLATLSLVSSPISGGNTNNYEPLGMDIYIDALNNCERILSYDSSWDGYTFEDLFIGSQITLIRTTENNIIKLFSMEYIQNNDEIKFTFNNNYLINMELYAKCSFTNRHEETIVDKFYTPMWRENDNDNFPKKFDLTDIDITMPISFDFTFYDIPSQFVDAYNGITDTQSYNTGYTQGYNDAVNDLVNDGRIYNTQDLDDYYNSGFNAGFDSGYQEGYNDASEELNETNTTASLIFTGILSVGMLPVNVFLSILDFEIFGINIAGFISGLLSVCIIIIIFRTILGGKNNND